MFDCNEWKTEKHHECANKGKEKRLKLWWQLYHTSLPEQDVLNITPMDFCWTECTRMYVYCTILYIYILQIHMSTSAVVICFIEWGCQFPNPQEIHCFKCEFGVRFARFRFAWLFQQRIPGVKQDLPVHTENTHRNEHTSYSLCYNWVV